MTRDNLILGMPASGKSTFIAALSYILFSDEVDTTLISELTDDETYISALQERWLRYEKLNHTPTAGEMWISFNLSTRDGQKKITLELPDFSGESLKSAVVTGLYPTNLADALRESKGIFLFTSATAKDNDVLLSDYLNFLSEDNLIDKQGDGVNSGQIEVEVGSKNEGGTGTPSTQATSTKKKELVFDPMEMPEQSKIVQLLQTISSFDSKIRKLVIMISAWDVVSSSGTDSIEPIVWLKNNRTMLWQYLQYSDVSWDVRVYGVSAQGGELPQDKAKLVKILRPSERVKLVGHGANPHDLTEPLNWMAAHSL